MAIRDVVMSSIYQTEHGTRYRGNTYIRTLHWSSNAILYFLNKKVETLANYYFLGNVTRDGKQVKTWLGFDEISNEAKGITENIFSTLPCSTILPLYITSMRSATSATTARS